MNTAQLKKALKPFKIEDSVFEDYMGLYNKYQKGPEKVLRWKFLRCPDEKKLVQYGALSIPERESLEAALARVAICKLNGGLGTSMGCRRSACSAPVRRQNTSP